jgi:hypothetical protein
MNIVSIQMIWVIIFQIQLIINAPTNQTVLGKNRNDYHRLKLFHSIITLSLFKIIFIIRRINQQNNDERTIPSKKATKTLYRRPGHATKN